MVVEVVVGVGASIRAWVHFVPQLSPCSLALLKVLEAVSNELNWSVCG